MSKSEGEPNTSLDAEIVSEAEMLKTLEEVASTLPVPIRFALWTRKLLVATAEHIEASSHDTGAQQAEARVIPPVPMPKEQTKKPPVKEGTAVLTPRCAIKLTASGGEGIFGPYKDHLEVLDAIIERMRVNGDLLRSKLVDKDGRPLAKYVTLTGETYVFNPQTPPLALIGQFGKKITPKPTYTEMKLRQWEAERYLKAAGKIMPLDKFMDWVWRTF